MFMWHHLEMMFTWTQLTEPEVSLEKSTESERFTD